MSRLITNRYVFLADLVRDKTVLDVGCVDHSLERQQYAPWLHRELKATAAEILGLDLNEAEVERMRERGFHAEAGDAQDFHLGRTFDVVVAGELIEHLPNPGGFLKSAREHLTPEGRLIITTPNALNVAFFLENLLLGREYDNPHHILCYTATTLTALLRLSGFEVESIRYCVEKTAHWHRNPAMKSLAGIKYLTQVGLGLLRPSVCHHMLVIARPSEADDFRMNPMIKGRETSPGEGPAA